MFCLVVTGTEVCENHVCSVATFSVLALVKLYTISNHRYRMDKTEFRH